jgi:hypothetical protein
MESLRRRHRPAASRSRQQAALEEKRCPRGRQPCACAFGLEPAPLGPMIRFAHPALEPLGTRMVSRLSPACPQRVTTAYRRCRRQVCSTAYGGANTAECRMEGGHREPNTLCSRLRDKRALPRRDNCVAAILNVEKATTKRVFGPTALAMTLSTSVYLTGMAAAQQIQLACDANDDGFVDAKESGFARIGGSMSSRAARRC